ncbi:MAG: ABC transporter permease [Candidatus Nanoarchaeia archaeon]|nr:ABC transporter permease [Candidatus Nanoarchaeia archaeon]
MKLNDLFNLTFKTIFQRSTRSWLTIIGIVIGIAAVVALNTLGQGLKVAVNLQLGFLGADLIQITAGKQSASFQAGPGQNPLASTFLNLPTAGVLTENDLSAIKNIYGVKAANGIVRGNVGIYYNEQIFTTTLNGVEPSEWVEVINYEIGEGRLLQDYDTYVAVIGNAVAKEFFSKEIRVGDSIIIEGVSFRVAGIIKSGAGFGLQDSYIFVPKEQARRLLPDIGSNLVSSIEVKVVDSTIIDEVEEAIAQRLRTLHHVSEGNEDFTLTSSKTIQERVNIVISMITIFVSGIAGIALIVGGVGIMNTMYMSIMERTREIGIMKAVGAKSRDVLLLFITEAGIIGFIGGMIGVFFGFVGALIGAEIISVNLTSNIRLPVDIYPDMMMLSILFASGVGIVAGYLPAKRASDLNPIDALRYE